MRLTRALKRRVPFVGQVVPVIQAASGGDPTRNDARKWARRADSAQAREKSRLPTPGDDALFSAESRHTARRCRRPTGERASPSVWCTGQGVAACTAGIQKRAHTRLLCVTRSAEPAAGDERSSIDRCRRWTGFFAGALGRRSGTTRRPAWWRVGAKRSRALLLLSLAPAPSTSANSE
ncbi:hypothetical protein HPB51_027498 [Rhipicephalus microplus]|uniref:Uncharacterized protein n=1 Tax=Rhipicephalus microplus TaxID=6941 RepID=A0A9J6D030_RHIMP|nr:hypothetical protein HPB51_027498 [Rhipicephalus microplus]